VTRQLPVTTQADPRSTPQPLSMKIGCAMIPVCTSLFGDTDGIRERILYAHDCVRCSGSAGALAETYLNCSTKKVIITSGPNGNTSSTTEEGLSFWIDDAAKTFRFGIACHSISTARQGLDHCRSRRHLLRVQSARWQFELRVRNNAGRRSHDYHRGFWRCEIAPSPVR